MAPDTKHLEVTLDTHVESVNVAEEMCLRVAESAGFGEDDCYRIGMSVREGVINAFHYGNQEKPDKKIHLAVDITQDKMTRTVSGASNSINSIALAPQFGLAVGLSGTMIKTTDNGQSWSGLNGGDSTQARAQ